MGASPSIPEGEQIVQINNNKKGESAIYRHVNAKDKLKERLDDDVKTLYDSFKRTVTKYPHNAYLGWRVGDSPYRWMSYKMAHTRATNVGAGLRGLGLTPHKDHVGLYSINRPEWVITGHGADAHSICLVPLYDTLGPEVVQYIVNQVELRVVCCSGDKVDSLIESAEKMKSLKSIVSFDAITSDQRDAAEKAGVTLLTLEKLEEDGKANPVAADPPSVDEIQTICYTSGTTGDPKGVLLTHGNMIAELAGVQERFAIAPTDVHISYLPLAHSFERVVMNILHYNGGAAGFYRGDVRLLFDDIATLQPTVFCSVPRLWNRLYDKVMAAVNAGSSLKKKLFNTAFESKAEALKEGYLTHTVYDSLVFSKIRAKLGGRVRVMVTGSAPLSETVMTFLRVCFSCPVMEGYGQTENAAALTSSMPWDHSVGHVGLPISSVELKLVDVPEQEYFVTDPNPRGEICFRGPIACQGYFKNKKKTDELIDADGWYHTGDVGEIIEGGKFKVIDRAKNIFKLSQGEYVAPEKIENVIVQSEYVAQCFVYGDSLKSKLVAIIVPDFEILEPYAKDQGIKGDQDALCANDKINATILEDIKAKGKVNKLRGFEFVVKISLSSEPFTVQNDLITPTFKAKRPQLKKRYAAEIDAMYEGID